MYIIKTGLGFVGCQSINQSEFNYQASDGMWRQASAPVESISSGATAMKTPKLRLLCACVCVSVCTCVCIRCEKGKRQNQEAKVKSAYAQENES